MLKLNLPASGSHSFPYLSEDSSVSWQEICCPLNESSANILMPEHGIYSALQCRGQVGGCRSPNLRIATTDQLRSRSFGRSSSPGFTSASSDCCMMIFLPSFAST